MGRHERLAELARVDRDGLVVGDLGCGPGRAARALLTRSPAPSRLHAVDQSVDLDDDLLADPRVVSRVADLDLPLPFEDAALDRIVSMNVMESLADPARFLAECHRVLVPGGLAVLGHSDFDTA